MNPLHRGGIARRIQRVVGDPLVSDTTPSIDQEAGPTRPREELEQAIFHPVGLGDRQIRIGVQQELQIEAVDELPVDKGLGPADADDLDCSLGTEPLVVAKGTPLRGAVRTEVVRVEREQYRPVRQ